MINQRPLEFRKLREFGDIINDTFLFIKQNLRPLLKVLFYLCGFFLLGSAIASILYQIGLAGSAEGNRGGIFGPTQVSQIFTFNYFLVLLFSWLTHVATTLAVLSYIALYIRKGNQAPSPEEVWGYFRYYFFRVFFSSVFTCFLLVICFVMCLLPGIYVFPAFSLFFPVMVLENADFGFSFNRSFKLLKDQWWITAGCMLVIWTIAYASMSFAAMPALLLTMAGTLLPALKEWSKVLIIAGTVVQHLTYVFMVIPLIGCALCYFNLTERLENGGLMDRVQKMGAGQDHVQGQEEY